MRLRNRGHYVVSTGGMVRVGVTVVTDGMAKRLICRDLFREAITLGRASQTSRCLSNTILRIGIPDIIAFMAKSQQHRDLFPGALEMMILQSLRMKPMHGYALVQHIQELSDDLLRVEEGSLYPALQRMLKEGWLESEAGISAKGRPTRIYRLTETGIRHLEEEVVQFERMFAGITRVLAVARA
jgi:PadR family transcriptional regulator, regulatory protein PadR